MTQNAPWKLTPPIFPLVVLLSTPQPSTTLNHQLPNRIPNQNKSSNIENVPGNKKDRHSLCGVFARRGQINNNQPGHSRGISSLTGRGPPLEVLQVTMATFPGPSHCSAFCCYVGHVPPNPSNRRSIVDYRRRTCSPRLRMLGLCNFVAGFSHVCVGNVRFVGVYVYVHMRISIEISASFYRMKKILLFSYQNGI